MFGGSNNKPTTGDEKFAGLEPGTYAVTLNDVNTGTRAMDLSTGLLILLQLTAKSLSIGLTVSLMSIRQRKKIYNSIARQMEALLIYDHIGEHKTLESFVQKAIDATYSLKGKTVEFTIKTWKMDGKSGVWGEITGFFRYTECCGSNC